jgi:chromosome segregation ATPase
MAHRPHPHKRPATTRRREQAQNTRLDLALAQLAALTKRVGRLERQEKTMAKTAAELKADLDQLTTDFDNETTAVGERLDADAAELKRLADLLAAGGTITAEDLQSIVDRQQAVSTRLKAMGTVPVDELPELPEQPPPTE